MGLTRYPAIHALLATNRYADIQSGYGGLYNWYAMRKIVSVGGFNVEGIAPAGWHVPTEAEWLSMINYLMSVYGGSVIAPGVWSVVGGTLKETGLTYWNSPNTGATDSITFSGKGNGYRDTAGSFANSLHYANFYWAYDGAVGNSGSSYQLLYNSSNFFKPGNLKKDGICIRCVRDETNDNEIHYIPPIPAPNYVTDIDGNQYPMVSPGNYVGNRIWMGADLRVTHYADGSPIPYLGDDIDWAADTTGAYCAYYF